MRLKTSSVKWGPFCPGGGELIESSTQISYPWEQTVCTSNTTDNNVVNDKKNLDWTVVYMYISDNILWCIYVRKLGYHWFRWWSGGWFNIKMTSYQYRNSHCGDKTILRSSYLHNGISHTGKMTSLYWIRALLTIWCQAIILTNVTGSWSDPFGPVVHPLVQIFYDQSCYRSYLVAHGRYGSLKWSGAPFTIMDYRLVSNIRRVL